MVKWFNYLYADCIVLFFSKLIIQTQVLEWILMILIIWTQKNKSVSEIIKRYHKPEQRYRYRLIERLFFVTYVIISFAIWLIFISTRWTSFQDNYQIVIIIDFFQLMTMIITFIYLMYQLRKYYKVVYE